MKCFKCQHDNPNKSNFCSKCGKKFQSKNYKDIQLNNGEKEKFIQSNIIYPQQESINALKLIKEKKSSMINKIWFGYVTIISTLAIINIFVHIEGYTQFFIFFGIFLTILILVLTQNMQRLSENQYYSIPISLDEKEQHRCIFCGNKGIYKSTIYKTNTTVNACSKCKEVLFHN